MSAAPADEVHVSAEAALRVREIQLWLCDLGRAFASVVLTPEGAFSIRCPSGGRHAFLLIVGDDGMPVIICPTCEQTPQGKAAFMTALSQRLPQWPMVPATGPLPVTGWQRQPEGAPAVAVRDLCNGTREALHEPKRRAEVDAWMASQ